MQAAPCPGLRLFWRRDHSDGGPRQNVTSSRDVRHVATAVGTSTLVASTLCSRMEDTMGRIVITEYVSLDGVIQGPGGGEDYKHIGWTFEFSRGEEGDQFKLDETLASEALLLGRVTYEGFAAAWPSMTGELADKLNSMPTWTPPMN